MNPRLSTFLMIWNKYEISTKKSFLTWSNSSGGMTMGMFFQCIRARLDADRSFPCFKGDDFWDMNIDWNVCVYGSWLSVAAFVSFRCNNRHMAMNRRHICRMRSMLSWTMELSIIDILAMLDKKRRCDFMINWKSIDSLIFVSSELNSESMTSTYRETVHSIQDECNSAMRLG